MEAARAIPLPDPPPEPIDLSEVLECAAELGDVDVRLSEEWRFRDGNTTVHQHVPNPLRTFSEQGGRDQASAGGDPEVDLPSRTRRRAKKKELVPLAKHTQLIEVRVECDHCPWTANSRNAMALAAHHARAHEHDVKARQTMETTFEGSKEKRDGAKPLFD